METWSVLGLLIALAAVAVAEVGDGRMLPIRIETHHPRHTEDILRHLGMAKVKAPDGSHRKRLASRPRHGHQDKPDSHVYVIKLPANKYYYEKKDELKGMMKAIDRKLNRLPVSFKTNGKPAKVYHWNLPEVQKLQAKRANQVVKWSRAEKMAEKKGVSYFSPKSPAKRPFQKYFPSNGKPHSLYVIERSHHKRPV